MSFIKSCIDVLFNTVFKTFDFYWMSKAFDFFGLLVFHTAMRVCTKYSIKNTKASDFNSKCQRFRKFFKIQKASSFITVK